MVSKDPEEFWRTEINKLSSTLPENGKKPPEIELMKVEAPKKPTKDGSRKVLVQKIITQVYVFTDASGKMYTSHTAQNLQIIGTMTLEEGLKRAQEDTFS